MRPDLIRIKEKTRKKCGDCEQVIQPNDLVIDYVSSCMGNHVNTRLMHLRCLLLRAKDIPTKAEYSRIYKENKVEALVSKLNKGEKYEMREMQSRE